MAEKKHKKESLKEVVDRLWPKTKQELEKAVENTKKLIGKGEEYVKVMSEKSAEQTKKLSLSFKRERLYYTLGKAVAKTAQGKWSMSKKINRMVKEIKDTDKEIKKIK